MFGDGVLPIVPDISNANSAFVTNIEIDVVATGRTGGDQTDERVIIQKGAVDFSVMNTETISVSSGTSLSRSTNETRVRQTLLQTALWPHPPARRSTFSCFARQSRSSTIMILACLTRVKQVSSSVSKDPRERQEHPDSVARRIPSCGG